MAINRTIIVAIPSGAYVEKNSYVFVKDKNVYDPEKRYNRVKHTIIGRSIGNGQMHPNHNYRLRYPALFEAAAGEHLPRQRKSLGFYAAALSIGERTGLYEALVQAFGVKEANMVMDFSIYSIIHHSFDEKDYPAVMADQMLFSGCVWNLAMLAAFFKEDISEERTGHFRKLWASACANGDNHNTGKEAWIAIDHSIVAIDTKSGVPITFSTCQGRRVDYKAVIEMIGWLKAYDIKVKGVIIDHDYATADVLTMLDQTDITYVVRLRDDALGHTSMVEQYGYRICMQYEYMLGRYDELGNRMDTPIDTDVLYGTGGDDRIRLFNDHPYEGYAAIIYNSTYGAQIQEVWYKSVSHFARSLQQQLDQGMEVDIPQEYADCIRIREKDGKRSVRVNRIQVQAIGDRKGFYTLASSLPLTAQEMNDIYSLKHCIGEQFSMVAYNLEGTAATEYQDLGSDEMQAKMMLAFISSIIRNELVGACTEIGVSANCIVDELNQISMNMTGNDKYGMSHTETEGQIRLLKACGVELEDLDVLAATENGRLLRAEPDPYQRYPRHNKSSEPPRRVGRPKGSGKKKA